MEIMKQTDEIRVDTEKEAQALIDSFKERAKTEGYELVSYTSTHKEKKDDDFYVVKIIKRW